MVKAATVGLLAAVLGLAPAASAAPEPTASGSGAERASGLWTYPREGPGSPRPFVFAEVFRPIKQTDGPGIAVVGIGACAVQSEGTAHAQETCRGSGVGHKLAPGEFELSPLLDEAVLDFTDTDGHQRITWRASGPTPEVSPAYALGPGGGAFNAALSRPSQAEGDVYGMALSQAVKAIASLSRAGGAGASVSGVGLERAEDGTFVLSFSRPAGR